MTLTPGTAPFAVPTRDRADVGLGVRQSDWTGGYDRLRFEVPNQVTEPRFFDSVNVEVSVEGELRLAAYLFPELNFGGGATSADQDQGLLIVFNDFLYILSRKANKVCKKSTSTPTTLVSMVGGPLNGVKAAVVWQNQLIVADNENKVWRLSTADAWSSYAPPAGVTQNCDAVGIMPDGSLAVWFNGKGLFSYSGTAWSARIWPTTDPPKATCDLLDGSGGSLVIALRDSQGSSLHEYFAPEGAATSSYVVTWIEIAQHWFYCATFYAGVVYLGGKRGSNRDAPPPGDRTNAAYFGPGLLWRKGRGEAPIIAHMLGDTRLAPNVGHDFGIRAMASDGDYLWIGGPARQQLPGILTWYSAGLYRYRVDEAGLETIMPSSFADWSSPPPPPYKEGEVYGVASYAGTIYLCSTAEAAAPSSNLWKRDTAGYANIGRLWSSIYDLRAPDHVKTWRFIQALVQLGGGVGPSVRIEYTHENAGGVFTTRMWSLGWAQVGADITVNGSTKLTFAHEDAALAKYFRNTRDLLLQITLYSGTATGGAGDSPQLQSYWIDAGQIKDVGVA